MNWEEKFSVITLKLQELVKRYEALERENERMRAELMPAKKREMMLLEQIGNLEQKVIVLKAASGQMEEADRKELDRRLHVYLKEIDRCIGMLSE